MKILTLLFAVITLLLVAASFSNAESSEVQCLPFSSITSITFEPGMTTSRRRTPNQPRMSCFGNCPSNAQVSSAQCQQQGMSDNGLPSWKCKGSFIEDQQQGSTTSNHQYRLGNVKVSCEGCTKPGDSSVVAGSCTLKYSIESRMRSRRGGSMHGRHSSSSTTTTSHYGDTSLGFFDMFIIFMVVFGTCYCCSAVNRERERRRYENQQHSHVVEGVPLDENHKPTTANGYPASSAGGVHHHHYSSRHSDGGFFGGGGGGFWNGMFLGSLMSGGFGGHGYHNTTVNNNFYGGDDDSSSWGGGGGGGGDSWGDGGGFGDSISD